MSISNLIDFDRNLGNQSQNFCSKSFSPNTLSCVVMVFAKKYIEILYKAWTSLPEISKEKAKAMKDSLFKENLHNTPKIRKK
ncbi:MAG: hypothetical protein WAJ84_02880 [Candidatus Rhabdochlamydia sp.]